MVWNVGNMSRHERDCLGDKSVQGKTNQREGRKALNQKIGSVKEMSTTSPSKYVMRMNNQENRTMRKKNCNIKHREDGILLSRGEGSHDDGGWK